MKKFFENFMDGKFIAALVAMIAGILGLVNCEDSTIALITNIVMVACPAIAYVITSGVLDWNKINTAIKQILDIIDVYVKSQETTDISTDEKEVVAGATYTNQEKEVIYKIAEILQTVVRK